MPLGDEPNLPHGHAIMAIAFRDDRSAEKVMMSRLSFEGCELASTVKFEPGERLRLHVRGQGLIEAKVQSVADGLSTIVFMTHCTV